MIKLTVKYDECKAEANGYSKNELIDFTTKYFETEPSVKKISACEWEDNSSDASCIFFMFMRKILDDEAISKTIDELKWNLNGREENCLQIEKEYIKNGRRLKCSCL